MVFTVVLKPGDGVVEEIEPICAEDNNVGAAEKLDANDDFVDCRVLVDSEALVSAGLVLNIPCDTD